MNRSGTLHRRPVSVSRWWTTIPAESAKRRQANKVRRQLRREFLEPRTTCQCQLSGCTRIATDVHEILPRGRSGGQITNTALWAALDRICHDWITTHDDWALRHGWLIQAGPFEAADLERAEMARLDGCVDRTCERDHRPERLREGWAWAS